MPRMRAAVLTTTTVTPPTSGRSEGEPEHDDGPRVRYPELRRLMRPVPGQGGPF
jgi:hypothetical protein